MGEQGPQNDLGAFVERLLDSDLGPLPGAAVILGQELNVRVAKFRQCHFGGVAHGLAGGAGISAGRQRQDQTDLEIAGAPIGVRLRRYHARSGRIAARQIDRI